MEEVSKECPVESSEFKMYCGFWGVWERGTDKMGWFVGQGIGIMF